MYKAHKKQMHFHRALDWGKLYIGGNRSGKSWGGVIEDIYWATGTHPYRETPKPPIRGRVVAVDYVKGIEQIILPLFKQFVVPSMLINGSWDDSYSKGERLLTFKNGSTIEFMSYEQETEKFAGTSRHFIHYDEEPPKNVFDECQLRIVDTNGNFWITMTPVEGITWVHSVIYEPTVNGPDALIIEPGGPNHGAVIRNEKTEILVIEVDQDENPHLSEEGKRRGLSLLDTEEDRAARKSGKFVQLGGLIFKTFDKNVHVIPPFMPPKNWEWYSSTDHGWNNPSAWLWHAVAPNGDVYTFSEHYQSELTVEEHAAIVLMREALWEKTPDIRTGDPAMKQTTAHKGTSIIQEYAEQGIYISVDSVPRDVSIGILRMQQYLRVHPVTKQPRWFITENCVNLIAEIQKLRWKKYASKKADYENNKREEIHKKDDHACDSARYFFTFMPDLSLSDYVDPALPPAALTQMPTTYAGALLRMVDEGKELEWDIVEGIDLQDMY
jgi:phage terminase large subunit-like protein